MLTFCLGVYLVKYSIEVIALSQENRISFFINEQLSLYKKGEFEAFVLNSFFTAQGEIGG